jgi:hypothetical protein
MVARDILVGAFGNVYYTPAVTVGAAIKQLRFKSARARGQVRLFYTKEEPFSLADTSRSVIAMKNYASTSTIGFLSSHSTTTFPIWTGINRDEEIKAAFRFLLRHVEHVIVNAEPIYEALDSLQKLLARFQTLVLEDPPSAKTDALAELWTKVRGNKRQLSDLNKRLELLKDLNTHRGKLLGLVTATLNLMMTAVHQLEEMRKGLQVASGSQ